MAHLRLLHLLLLSSPLFLLPASLYGRSRTEAPADCRPLDLRRKLPPVRDQDSIGWCHAFTAADLASFKTGKTVSASAIALSFNQHWFTKVIHSIRGLVLGGRLPPQSDREGGRTDVSFEKAQKEGFCLESEVPSTDYADSRQVSQYRSTLKKIEATQRELDERFPSWVAFIASPLMTPENHAAIRDRRAEKACRDIEPIHRMFPTLGFGEIVEALERSSESDVIRHLAQKSCKKRIRPEKELKIETVTRWGKAWTALDQAAREQLDAGNILEIGYDSQVLFDPKASGPVNHSSLLVGRKWNPDTGSCELLVRNSYGPNCTYHSSYRCEGGNVWIPRETLFKAVTEVRYAH